MQMKDQWYGDRTPVTSIYLSTWIKDQWYGDRTPVTGIHLSTWEFPSNLTILDRNAGTWRWRRTTPGGRKKETKPYEREALLPSGWSTQDSLPQPGRTATRCRIPTEGLGNNRRKRRKFPGFNLREDRTTKTLVTVLNCTIYNCYHPRLKTE